MTTGEPKTQDGPAVFSPCGQYRYVLRRRVGLPEETALFVMLNPSTADAAQDDPTVRRCQAFARQWGYGRLIVCNLFALRSTDPAKLYEAGDPVGPENDSYIQAEAGRATLVVAAWGNHGAFMQRSRQVRRQLADVDLYCLGWNGSGEPKHPLYVPSSQGPILWRGQ